MAEKTGDTPADDLGMDDLEVSDLDGIAGGHLVMDPVDPPPGPIAPPPSPVKPFP
jgi:hypothetical protein